MSDDEGYDAGFLDDQEDDEPTLDLDNLDDDNLDVEEKEDETELREDEVDWLTVSQVGLVKKKETQTRECIATGRREPTKGMDRHNGVSFSVAW